MHLRDRLLRSQLRGSGGFQWLPVPSSGYVSGYPFEANAISGDGSTTVGYINQAGGLGSAWKWTESGGLVLLSTSGITVATAVNTNGSVIVGNYGTDPESLAGVSWNASGTETVLSPAGYYSAFGVNGTGDVIVGGAAPAYLPVTWTSGGAAVPLHPRRYLGFSQLYQRQRDGDCGIRQPRTIQVGQRCGLQPQLHRVCCGTGDQQ